MACISYPKVDEAVTEDESIQALARKLPEGDALPDGFSECFTVASDNDVSAMPSKASSMQQEGGIPSIGNDGISNLNIKSSRILQDSPEELTHRLDVMSKLTEEDTLPDDYSGHIAGAPCNDESDFGLVTHKDDRVYSEEQCCPLEMKIESSRTSDNLPEEFPDTLGVAICSARSQGLAEILPEGDALPDGFSECFTEVSDKDHPDIDLMKESNTLTEDEVTSEMKTERVKILDALPEEFLAMDGGTHSLSRSQLVAQRLPEGDVLPDGFSESFTAPDNDTSTTYLSKESSTNPQTEVSAEKKEFILDPKMESSRILGTLPEKFQDVDGETSSLSAGQNFLSESSDKELHDGSPTSSPSERNQDRRGKLRRFPVQLSDKESFHHSHESVGYGSENHADNSERACTDNEFSAWSNMNKTLFTNLHTTSLSATDVPVSPASHDMDYKLCTDNHGEFPGEETARTVKKGETEIKNAHFLDELSTCETVLLTEEGAEAKDSNLETSGRLSAASLKDKILILHSQNEQLNNDMNSARADLAKSLLIREKLESLCRELQRQNKQLSDECKKIASEEQQKRVDLSIGFHAAIKDVTIKLEEQGDQRVRQIKENEMLQEKLRHFTQQYEFWEQQYAQQLRTKALEQQVLELKLKQQEELSKQGEAKIQVYTEQIVQLLKTERDLRGRLALYGDKFQQFQDTLTKSNEVFASFKIEMEKMSKTVKKLEKENLSLKKKCEKSDVSIIELVDERELLRKQLETARNQKEKLEALCRVLQAERKQQNVAMASSAPTAAAIGSASGAATSKLEQAHLADISAETGFSYLSATYTIALL